MLGWASKRFSFYDYRNNLFRARFILKLGATPIVMMFVATSSLAVPICLGTGL